MKKHLLAYAVLTLATHAAMAQSAVTIYGIADAALVGENGGSGGHVTKVSSGAASASRIGFRGTEDLGDGMQAFFTLENGAKIDTGELDANNTLFNRQAFVGLKTKAGSLALGRQYTPYHMALLQAIDPFGTGYAGTSKNLLPDNGANVRASNSVTYTTPTVQGVNIDLFYSAGEQSEISAGRQVGAGVSYAQGPLSLRLIYNAKNSDVVATGVNHDIGRNVLIGGNYDFKIIQVYAGFEVDKGFNSAPLYNANNPYGGVKPTASTDGRDYILGFKAPVGPGILMFSVQRKDDRTSFNQDANEWGIGYLYALSKRTGLYAAYAHINNKNGAGYTVDNNTDAGTGNTGYNLGIRQTF
ncbi:porin [Massilia sp. 9096]|uniref:porin n=1 Tax=Massilia sp. 9096 TaxID=1500894 RepID=UPI00055D61FF|nr:porin [Massilia sp. 9096]